MQQFHNEMDSDCMEMTGPGLLPAAASPCELSSQQCRVAEVGAGRKSNGYFLVILLKLILGSLKDRLHA